MSIKRTDKRAVLANSGHGAVRWLGTADLRARFQVSDRSIENWIAAGRLPPPTYFGAGRRVRRWRETDIEAIERQAMRKSVPVAKTRASTPAINGDDVAA